jgi:hypothetical protein
MSLRDLIFSQESALVLDDEEEREETHEYSTNKEVRSHALWLMPKMNWERVLSTNPVRGKSKATGLPSYYLRDPGYKYIAQCML